MSAKAECLISGNQPVSLSQGKGAYNRLNDSGIQQHNVIHDLPYWRVSLQDYVVDLVLNLKNLDFKKAKILDLGCGVGYTLTKLSRLLPSGVELVGIDDDEAIVAKANSLVRAKGDTSKVMIRAVDAESMPFHDGAFDLVIANLVFSVFRRPSRIAAATARILKPDGILIATEVSGLSMLGRIGELADALRGHLYYHLFSPSQLAKLFAGAGLAPRKILRVPVKMRVSNACVRIPSRISPVFLLRLAKNWEP